MLSEPAVQPAALEPTQAKTAFSWRLLGLLAVLSLVTSVLVIPYSIRLATITQPALAGQEAMLAVSTVVQVIILYWPMIAVGLLLAYRMGLGAPYLHAWLHRQPMPGSFRRPLLTAALIGFLGGALILGLAALLEPTLPTEMTSISPDQIPNAFEGFLASISAGVNEELTLRLFLLTALAWLGQLIFQRRTAGRPVPAILWVANVLVAVVFGLLHLTNVALIGAPITAMVVVYVILLNGLLGLAFGWLYWKYGIESAMLAHFFADIVLHVITVLFV